MPNPGNGNDQPTPDQTAPEQRSQNPLQAVMKLLTEMRQEANDDRAAMRQFMGTVTRRLANPLEPIESVVFNLRAPSDDPEEASRGFDVRVYPPIDRNDPQSLERSWEQWLRALSPGAQERFYTLVRLRNGSGASTMTHMPGSLELKWETWLSQMPLYARDRFQRFIDPRINAANIATTQLPGGEGAPDPFQDNHGNANIRSAEPGRTESQAPRHSPQDEAALLNRIQELEEELRQVRARQSSTTPAPLSNADPVTRKPMRPPITPGQAPSAVPEVSQPAVQEPPSNQLIMSTSSKTKGTAIGGSKGPEQSLAEEEQHDAVLASGSSTNIPPGAEDVKLLRPLSKQARATDEARESAAPETDTSSGKNGAARGTKKSAVGRGRAGTGKQDNVQADSPKATQAKPKTGEKTNRNPEKENESFDYETDSDSDRKKYPGWKNTRESPKRKVVVKDNQGVIDRAARQAARVARANSEATAGTARSTQSGRRGRTKSVPLATTSVSATTSPVSKSSGKRKAVNDIESDDDKKADALDDIDGEPEGESNASSSSSEGEDDDGQGGQIGNRRPSTSSGDDDESQKALGARQRATRSASKITQGNKGQRAERHDRRNAPSTTTRARGPQSEQDDSGNDNIQDHDTTRQSKRTSDIAEPEAAEALEGFIESDSDSPGSVIPDEIFEESLVDDANPGPTVSDEEGVPSDWEDGCEAKHPDEAYIFSKRPKSISKPGNSRQSTIGFGSRHGNKTPWVERPANDGNNNNDKTAKTGEKRKSNSPSPAAVSDGAFSHPFKSLQSPALTSHQQKNKTLSRLRRRNKSQTMQSRPQPSRRMSSEFLSLSTYT